MIEFWWLSVITGYYQVLRIIIGYRHQLWVLGSGAHSGLQSPRPHVFHINCSSHWACDELFPPTTYY